MALSVGDRVGPYEVLSEIGSGGMARIFAGRQTGPGGFVRRVAIKLIHANIATDPDVLKMFLDEARLSACIQHPNVVKVEALGEHEGAPYIVMEHIDGASLAAILRGRAQRREPIAVDVAVAIAARVAEGLHAAHESTDELGNPLGIVHRDVSPSNVLIDRKGHVKLIDFGVAKARERLATTRPGSVKGKLAYMAPEQLLAGPFDRRADVFALGIMLWEMLTLRRLFYASTDIDTILRIKGAIPIEPPSAHRADLPPRLDDVVLTMLARDLEERFTTCAAARHAMLVSCPAALQTEAQALAALVPTEAERSSLERTPIEHSGEEPTAPQRPSSKPG
jgi:eukaryotic-like serine/threonine-protein kinase